MYKVKIQLIRNASIKIEYAGKSFLVDPVLGDQHSFMSFVERDKKLNPTVGLPLSVEEIIRETDALIITHTHPDHFDEKAMQVLNKSLPVFTQKVDVDNIAKAGFRNVKGVEQSEVFEEIELIKTGGKHGPEKDLELLGEVSGYILKKENYPTIYIVGDCLWDAEIEENLRKHQPDIVITNSGGAVFMGQSRILMNETETIKVAQAAPQARVVAVHMEALDHCKTTRSLLKEAAENAAANILIPLDGECIEL